ncbi:MAG TPA: hypothetical protein VHN11_10920 [Xanthobacteraceae bacterium]|jgi:hypothetical protein|nr:hypothetical protein [Xanthobacteraceae bacterium]
MSMTFLQAIEPAFPLGLARLTKIAFDGGNLSSLWDSLLSRAIDAPHDAAALLDLSIIAHLTGRLDERQMLQGHALDVQRIYRKPPAITEANSLRLLAFMAPGDFMANIPVEFLLENSAVSLDIVYVIPGKPLPDPLPDHDVAFVAVAESAENQPILKQLAALLPSWPRPIINAPERIAQLTREGTWALLKNARNVVIPMNARVSRDDLMRIATSRLSVEEILNGSRFPVIVRPLDSHAGNGLAKLDDRAAIETYLQERSEQTFTIAPFVEYRSADGLYRKYRVALIAGRPYACHMAISHHWMIHYLNAGMLECAEKRAEEARFMMEFDADFGARHRDAFKSIAWRIGLDYVVLDCGETCDGQLLVFESGTNMIVHAMDAPDLFPYKRPQMEKVFADFVSLLRDRAAGQQSNVEAPDPDVGCELDDVLAAQSLISARASASAGERPLAIA